MATGKPQTLGACLRAARLEAGLSVRQLARLAGITHGYLTKLETDQMDSPSAAYLQRLADALELDASDLLSFIGVEPSSTLPSPRVYFRRKFGLNDAEAAHLSQLIKEYTNKSSNQGDHAP